MSDLFDFMEKRLVELWGVAFYFLSYGVTNEVRWSHVRVKLVIPLY
jgi:hypothetical protein